MKARSLMLLAALLAVTLLLPACLAGSNMVPLTYPQEKGDYPWCRWRVAVVGFSDARQDKKTLGPMDDQNNMYVAATDVSDWFTRAFFEELKSRGCDCVYKDSLDSVGDMFAISGDVLTVHLEKTGFTDFSTKLQTLVRLTRNGEQIYAETYTGEMDKTYVIATDAPEKIMAESLQYVVTDAVTKLIDHMKQAD